jgi:uncharacterized protein (DUF697 family)/tellurite resistance protein
MEIPAQTDTAANESLLAICLFAAFSDGEKSDAEREEVGRLANELGAENLAPVSRSILMGKLSIDQAVSGLQKSENRLLAYEMARAVCEAGGSISADEEAFLKDLRGHLSLGPADQKYAEDEVDAVSLVPIDTDPVSAGPDNGTTILKYSILNGALELLPETLATIAIIPLQMKMVHGIGKSHGVQLDRSNIKDFLATAGIGMGSQIVEGFARKLMGGFGKKLGGSLAGKAADQLTGSAFSFASTYAIGQLAETYYAGGATLDAAQLKSQFPALTEKAKALHAKYLPEIQSRASSLNVASILSLVRGKGSV